MWDIRDRQRVITSSSLTLHFDDDTGSLTVAIRIDYKLIINATDFTLSVRSAVGAPHVDHFSGSNVTEWDVELATEWKHVTNLLFVPLTALKPAASVLPVEG